MGAEETRSEGDSFDFDRLCRVAGLAENEAWEALEELLKRGLLREQRQATARPYVLAHDRFREVVYDQSGQARRRILHRRAFEMLEAAAAAPAAELARHAWAAGLLAQAFELNVSAGEEAMQLYAPQTATEHFTRALTAARQLIITPSPQLYRSRGHAYETIGDFDRAQSDFQLALDEAQDQGDRQSEWQALQDLGFLWASRDYARAGDYFQQALTLARNIGEPATLAHSLNRVGNWHVNIEQPFKALDYHQEALAIFEELAERAGQAETLDLLGIACYLGANLKQSFIYYRQAVALFRELDNCRGLVSGMAMMSLVLQGSFTIKAPSDADVTQSVPLAESAMQLAREISWRTGKSLACLALGQNFYFQGKYGSALDSVQCGLAVAEEIDHPLWITYAHWTLVVIYLDLVALPEALQHLEQALALARKTGSMFWTHASVALLALACTWHGKHARAESALEMVSGSDIGGLDSVEWSALTAMQRLVWYAQAELALACRKPTLALQIVEQLIASTPDTDTEPPVLRLAKLRGDILAALGQTAEAETVLRQAQAMAVKQGKPPMLWRIHVALGQLYQT